MDGNLAVHRGKEKYIHGIFSEIAPMYEFVNHALSFNLDRFWRRKAISRFYRSTHQYILDTCCGTGELTEILRKKTGSNGRIIGIDFCENMLDLARERHEGIESIRYEIGNIQQLNYPTGEFDAVYNCFALRNLSNIPGAIQEMRRVVKPGGQVVVINLTLPKSPIWLWYLTHVVPFIGRLCHGNEGPYSYLSASIRHFCVPEELRNRLMREGLEDVEYAQYIMPEIVHQGYIH